MPNYNHCTFVGHVTRDLQLKNTGGGNYVCDVGLAVNDSYKSASGERIESVMFLDCTCFGKTAEIASQYLRKGAPVLLAGRLKLDSWEKDGVKHSRHKLLVDRLQLLDPPKSGERPAAPPQRQAAQPAAFGVDFPDESIPF